GRQALDRRGERLGVELDRDAIEAPRERPDGQGDAREPPWMLDAARDERVVVEALLRCQPELAALDPRHRRPGVALRFQYGGAVAGVGREPLERPGRRVDEARRGAVAGRLDQRESRERMLLALRRAGATAGDQTRRLLLTD